MSFTMRATLFDGRRPVGRDVEVVCDGGEVVVRGDGTDARHRSDAVRVSPRVAGADRFVALPDGTQLLCPDDPGLDALPQEVPSEGPVAWLERRWAVAVAGILAIAAIVAAGYLWGIPAAARRVAARVPPAAESLLGDNTLQWLDRALLAPTRLPDVRQQALQQEFERLHAGLASSARLRLHFRRWRDLPNALALPGGAIVVTDDLVERAGGDDEVLAGLAHEIGHVEHRHALRSLLEGSALALVGVVLTGDVASLGAAAAGVPTALGQAAYSRAMETEADEFAFALLLRAGRSPEAFATLMERLTKDEDAAGLGYLDSHPVTAERIARARAAARR